MANGVSRTKYYGTHSFNLVMFCLSSPLAIPEDDVLGNNKIALFVTKKGGHIGFLEGLLPSPKNMINKALVQFAVAVLEKGVA